MIHTGRCKHCGKPEKEHYGRNKRCAFRWDSEWFYDSGLAALDAHKEELYEAAKLILFEHGRSETFLINDDKETSMSIEYANRIEQALDKLESILNQIEKEK